ncbi:MAG: hypothetical protein AAGC71_18230 [Pseudomonadota bacterium]
MNATTDTAPSILKSRLQLLALAVVFFGPFLYAAWLFYGDNWVPPETTNNGELIDPPLQLPNIAVSTYNGEVDAALRGMWTLFYLEREPCGDPCRDSLVQIRQVRLAAGRDVDRIRRIYLGATLPESNWLESGHKGLVAGRLADNETLAATVEPLDSGYYLIDPVGQVMMRYDTSVESKPLYKDLHRLLKLTR